MQTRIVSFAFMLALLLSPAASSAAAPTSTARPAEASQTVHLAYSDYVRGYRDGCYACGAYPRRVPPYPVYPHPYPGYPFSDCREAHYACGDNWGFYNPDYYGCMRHARCR
ncbi:MAG: hypothetical protein NW215_08400 [Hyphomicrobiales bacterium]|nr:hypothetical protein [Hyphomicrobiales bacterium]